MFASSSAKIVAFHIFYAARCIDELSRGSILGFEILTNNFYRNVSWLLAKSCVLLVFCIVSMNSLTMAAAGAIRRRHLPDGSIQLLPVKPWTCSIRRCAPRCTAASPWQLKLPAICLHFLLPSIRCLPLP